MLGACKSCKQWWLCLISNTTKCINSRRVTHLRFLCKLPKTRLKYGLEYIHIQLDNSLSLPQRFSKSMTDENQIFPLYILLIDQTSYIVKWNQLACRKAYLKYLYTRSKIIPFSKFQPEIVWIMVLLRSSIHLVKQQKSFLANFCTLRSRIKYNKHESFSHHPLRRNLLAN